VILIPAQPNASELHINHFLTDMAIAWFLDESKFIAGKVFPTLPVEFKSDDYPIYQKGYFYRDEFAVRPYGGRPKEIGYKIEKGSYSCEEEALEAKIDDRQRANAEVGSLDPDIATQRLLRTQALIHRDNEWAGSFFKTGVWTVNWEGKEKAPTKSEEETEEKFLQFDQVGSEPITFVHARLDDVGGKTGYRPNIGVFGVDLYRVLVNHPAVVERIKYTQRGIVSEDLLAELLGLEKVFVARGVINSAVEGETNSINYIVNRKSMLLVYANAAPSIQEPSGGYSFAWTGLLPGVPNAWGGVIETGREQLSHSDVMQCRCAFTQAVTAPDLGEFFAECVSS
jgi:hypothetical protein